MKSTTQMKQEMSKRLENLEARRKSLESQAEAIDKRLGDVRQEIGRLTGAIAALDGVTLEDKYLNAKGQAAIDSALRLAALPQGDEMSTKWTPKFNADLIPDTVIQAHPTNPRKGMLDGIEIDIPEGMHLGKNSFGEDALISDGVELPPMAEPLVPTNKVQTVLVSNEFDDPTTLY